MLEKKMKIKDIKISNKFKRKTPHKTKMKEKWEYYRRTGKLKEKVKIDKDGVLVDGYTSYLIAEADGLKQLKVIVQ